MAPAIPSSRGVALLAILLSVGLLACTALSLFSITVKATQKVRKQVRELKEAVELEAILTTQLETLNAHRLDLEPHIHAPGLIVRSNRVPLRLPTEFALDRESTPISVLELELSDSLLPQGDGSLCSQGQLSDARTAVGLTTTGPCIYAVTQESGATCIAAYSKPLPSLIVPTCRTSARPLIAIAVRRERTVFRTRKGELRAIDTAGNATVLHQPLMKHVQPFQISRISHSTYRIASNVGPRTHAWIVSRAITPLPFHENLQLVFR